MVGGLPSSLLLSEDHHCAVWSHGLLSSIPFPTPLPFPVPVIYLLLVLVVTPSTVYTNYAVSKLPLATSYDMVDH